MRRRGCAAGRKIIRLLGDREMEVSFFLSPAILFNGSSQRKGEDS